MVRVAGGEPPRPRTRSVTVSEAELPSNLDSAEDASDASAHVTVTRNKSDIQSSTAGAGAGRFAESAARGQESLAVGNGMSPVMLRQPRGMNNASSTTDATAGTMYSANKGVNSSASSQQMHGVNSLDVDPSRRSFPYIEGKSELLSSGTSKSLIAKYEREHFIISNTKSSQSPSLTKSGKSSSYINTTTNNNSSRTNYSGAGGTAKRPDRCVSSEALSAEIETETATVTTLSSGEIDEFDDDLSLNDNNSAGLGFEASTATPRRASAADKAEHAELRIRRDSIDSNQSGYSQVSATDTKSHGSQDSGTTSSGGTGNKLRGRIAHGFGAVRNANARRKMHKVLRASEQVRWNSFNSPEVIIELLKAEGYKSERSTETTVTQWPHELPKSADLASAGFYFSPKPNMNDRCICAFCGIKMEAWTSEDDPFIEHARESPHCIQDGSTSTRNQLLASDNGAEKPGKPRKRDKLFRRSLSRKDSSQSPTSSDNPSPSTGGGFKGRARNLTTTLHAFSRSSMTPESASASPMTSLRMSKGDEADLPTLSDSQDKDAGCAAVDELAPDVVNATRSPIQAGSKLPSAAKTEDKRPYVSPYTYSDKEIEQIAKVQARWKQVRRRRAMLKLATRRKHIAMELLRTEQSYVQQLRALVECYMQPLRALPSKEAILSSSEIQLMFSNVEMLFTINTTLLKSLDERVTKWFPLQQIGDLFAGSNAHTLKFYTAYVNNHDSAHQLWEEKMKASKRFAKFVALAREDASLNPGHLELEQLLIVPVQRLPRYMLLLEDLLRNTWDGHPDATNLAEATQTVRELNRLVDARRGDHADTEKMVELKEKLSGSDTKDLCQPHRRLLAELPVEIWLRDVLEWQSRHLFLCNDLFLVTSPVKHWKQVLQKDAGQQKYRIEHLLAVTDAKFLSGTEYERLHAEGASVGQDARPPAWGVDALDTDPRKAAFVYWPKVARTSSDVLWFRVAPHQVAAKEEWLQEANQAVDNLRENTSKLRRIQQSQSSRFLT